MEGFIAGPERDCGSCPTAELMKFVLLRISGQFMDWGGFVAATSVPPAIAFHMVLLVLPNQL